MDNTQIVKQFVKELAIVETANPKEIADKISMNISNEKLDKFNSTGVRLDILTFTKH